MYSFLSVVTAFFRWSVGLFFGLLGLFSFFISFFAGIFFLLLSAITIPKSSSFITSRLPFELKAWQHITVGVVLFFLAIFAFPSQEIASTNAATTPPPQPMKSPLATTQSTPEPTPEVSPTPEFTPTTTIKPTSEPTFKSTPKPTPLVTPKPTPNAAKVMPLISSTPRPTTKPAAEVITGSSYSCDCSKTCANLSCAEAQYQLNTCGCNARDGDNDGIACDKQCQ